MNKETEDAADFYREKDFPGKKLLGMGAAILALYWLAGWGLNFESIPREIEYSIGLVTALGLVLYLVGFWKAVKGKGYHPVLFLISFTGFIGLIVMFSLPNMNENQPAQVNPCNPQENPRIT